MTPLAAIHVAKKRLGMDEETYRGFLVRETGKASAKDMSEAERLKVVRAFEREGFSPARAPSSGPSGHLLPRGEKEGRAREGKQAPAFVRKAQALWIAAWNLGLVANRSDKALAAFVKRQTGVDRAEWVKDAKAQRAVVEALKAMTGRAGVDWTEDGRAADEAAPGCRIARAQFAALKAAGEFPGLNSLRHWLSAEMRQHPENVADWIAAMNTLGVRIRAGSRT